MAADTEAIFGPLDCGFETHVIAHTNYHVPENAPKTGERAGLSIGTLAVASRPKCRR